MGRGPGAMRDRAMTDQERVRGALEQSADLLRATAGREAAVVVEAARRVAHAIREGRSVLTFGNGGSATDAQHVACELVGRFLKDRDAWPAVALTADSAVLTSVANDYGVDQMFARQIAALGRPGDIALGITTSGTSANVNEALRVARERGLATIGLTGRDGGATAGLVDVHINVASESTPRVQEVHRAVLHVLCELVEDQLV